MSNSSRSGFPRRRAALASVFTLMLSLIVYVSPGVEKPAHARDSVLPPGGSATASSNPIQAQCPISASPAAIGAFDPIIRLPTIPIHISVLPNGKLLFWGRDKTGTPTNPKDAAGQSDAYIWDPSSVVTNMDGTRDAVTTLVRNPTTNLFCSGHSFLPDGRLLVTGGHKHPDYDGAGESHLNVFNYSDNTWARGPNMNQGRWYPYNVTLATGEPLIMSGSYWGNEPSVPVSISPNLTPQLYTLEGRLKNLAPASSLSFYPYLHLGPDGKVFQVQSGRLIVSGFRNFSRASRIFDPNANRGMGSWRDVGGTNDDHESGSAVMYDVSGKILLAGGFTTNNVPVSTAEVVDLTAATPTWRTVNPMNQPRVYNTSTLLPNGKVLVTGGTQCPGGNNVDCNGDPFLGAVMDAEMWDPSLSSDPAFVPWCKMARQREIRAYHSVAVLLPDATVLVGGGGRYAAIGEVDENGIPITSFTDPRAKTYGHKNVEIYRPSYLFDSFGNQITSRPVITSAPLNTTTISYGQTFTVGVSGAGTAPKVSLVRLPTVTHAFNQDQRILFLNRTVNGSTSLSVVAPTDPNKCPPGHYMLFVMNSAGVPSVAKIVKIGQDDGYIDGVNGGQVWGWAWDRNFPNNPINVDIYEGDTFIARVAADLFRQDLLNANKGNGYHAFVYNIPPELWKDGQVHQINVRFANSTINLSTSNLASSPRSIAVASMFPVQSGPINTTSAGGQTWEPATQFSSNVAGKITHVRYYRAPGETGTHVGRIWSDTGTLLALVTFQNETASGWQTQALPTPLTISAGVKYRVSYNVNLVGVNILNTFTPPAPPITNANLTAWGSMYGLSAGAFPTLSNGSNFLADVIFEVPR